MQRGVEILSELKDNVEGTSHVHGFFPVYTTINNKYILYAYKTGVLMAQLFVLLIGPLNDPFN